MRSGSWATGSGAQHPTQMVRASHYLSGGRRVAGLRPETQCTIRQSSTDYNKRSLPPLCGREQELRRYDAHGAPLPGFRKTSTEALLMKRSKYYIRVMRPTFQRAILTVQAESDEAAVRSALKQAERLTESDWARLEAVREPPVIEIALSEDETERDTEAGILEFVSDVEHAYALLQADLETGEGAFIAPTWLKLQPELMIADITQDWAEDLAGISDAGTKAFYDWLTQQGRPTNVVDFFAERDKRRGKTPHEPDADD